MKTLGLSIKYKILLLLTSVPLLVLSAYLYLAVNVFQDDKVAYVFDSSVNVSSSIASQVKTQLNAILSVTRPLFQDIISSGSFTDSSKAIFYNELYLDSFVVFQKQTNGSFLKIIDLEKAPGVFAENFQKLHNKWSFFLSAAEKNERWVVAPFADDRIFIFEKVENKEMNKTMIFLISTRLNELYEVFKKSIAQKMYLIDPSGIILSGPEGLIGKKIQENVPLSFIENQRTGVSQGTEAVTDKNNNVLLASFSKVGFADLFVVSTVEKSKALNAVQILIKKSVLFFLILICVTIVISLFASNSLTSALTDLFQATQSVSEGKFNIKVQVKSSDEVGILADNFNKMAAEVSRLLEQTAEKARMESELQTAKTVQETLFPEPKAQIMDLQISGFYEPASECGGDWWHYSKVGEQVFLWIGDATGHGAPAALITSAAKSAATIIEKLVHVTPAQAMDLLNRSIFDVSKGRIMMTFFIAAYNSKTGLLTYSNASHEAPYLVKKTSEGKVKKKDLIPLNEVNNPRLGQNRDTTYSETSVQLEEGDTVFFYTDGIPDIQDSSRQNWGEREFLKHLILVQQNHPSAQEIVEAFSQALQSYRQGASLIDDVTFFAVKKERNLYG